MDDRNFGGRGAASSGEIFHAAPNIDHSQQFVKADIVEWMQWLREYIGYDGWRCAALPNARLSLDLTAWHLNSTNPPLRHTSTLDCTGLANILLCRHFEMFQSLGLTLAYPR